MCTCNDGESATEESRIYVYKYTGVIGLKYTPGKTNTRNQSKTELQRTTKLTQKTKQNKKQEYVKGFKKANWEYVTAPFKIELRTTFKFQLNS